MDSWTIFLLLRVVQMWMFYVQGFKCKLFITRSQNLIRNFKQNEFEGNCSSSQHVILAEIAVL